MDHANVILVIEDSEEDFQTVKRLLGRVTDQPVERFRDGPSAMAYLRSLSETSESGKRPPCIILLDLNMPGEDGRSILVRLKGDERLRRIPVVIVTTSSNPKDVEYCYDHGAAGSIVKPVDLGRFRTSVETMADYWLRAVLLAPGRFIL